MSKAFRGWWLSWFVCFILSAYLQEHGWLKLFALVSAAAVTSTLVCLVAGSGLWVWEHGRQSTGRLVARIGRVIEGHQ